MSEEPPHFDVLEAVEDMGDGTVRESWARYYRDYEGEYWYVIRPGDPPLMAQSPTAL